MRTMAEGTGVLIKSGLSLVRAGVEPVSFLHEVERFESEGRGREVHREPEREPRRDRGRDWEPEL